MKTLIIIRHGKSDWNFQDVSDIDRSLKERGIRDGYKMAERLKKKNVIPDLIISSTANRAMHSASIFTRVLGVPASVIRADESLYMADENDILSCLYRLEKTYNTIMIFGHNPGFTYLANELSGLNIMNIPTTGMAILQFDVEEWNMISKNKLKKEYFDFPRNE